MPRRDLGNGLILSGKGEEVKVNVHTGEVQESRVTESLTGLLFPGVQIQGSWRREQELVHTRPLMLMSLELMLNNHWMPCTFEKKRDLSR